MIFLFHKKKLWMKIETKKTILHVKKLKYDTLSGVLLSNCFDLARLCSSSTWVVVRFKIGLWGLTFAPRQLENLKLVFS